VRVGRCRVFSCRPLELSLAGGRKSIIFNRKETTMSKCKVKAGNECPANGRGSRRNNQGCLGACKECGDHLEEDGRQNTFCPTCDDECMEVASLELAEAILSGNSKR
jgi:hypothetical protein